MDLAIPNFKPTTDVDETAEAWKKWAKLFTRKIRFFKVDDAEDRLIALQIYGGDAIDELIETLDDGSDAEIAKMPKEWGILKLKGSGDADETITTFHKAIHKVHVHFTTSTNKDAARSKFESMRQGDLPMASYYVDLKKQAEKCGFADASDSIRTRILQTMTDKKLRREAMAKNYSLKDLLKWANTKEDVERQASAIEKEETVHRVYEQRRTGGSRPRRGRGRGQGQHRPDKPREPDHKQTGSYRQQSDKSTCEYCGYNHGYGRNRCPASALCESL